MKLAPQIKILVLILFIFIPDALGASRETGPRKIVDVRTGVHEDKGFHRLVVELDGEVGYSIQRQDNKVLVLISGAELKGPVDKSISTDIIKFEEITVRTGRDGPVVILKVAFRKGSLVRHSIWKDPFRIVVDFRVPQKASKEALESAGKKVSKKVEQKAPKEVKKKAAKKAGKKTVKKTAVKGAGKTGPKAVARKKAPKRVVSRPAVVSHVGIPFNDGWRVEYRKKIMWRLKHEIDRVDTIEAETLRAVLGLKSSERPALAIEADALARASRDGGEPDKAVVLDALVEVFEKGTGWVRLATVVRNHPGSGLERLGWFFVARRLEAIGFYPEALGFYSRVEGDGDPDAVGSAATFLKARLRFFMGRFDEARTGFVKSRIAGFRNSAPWLANTFMVNGEVDRALGLYRSLSGAALTAADPVTLLSVGEARVMARDFRGALSVYETLHSRYRDDELLGPFFLLKKGEVFLARGELEEALELYGSVKDMYDGEALAMASLALAGQLVKIGDTGSLAEAEEIYKGIVGEDYAGAAFAELNMASTEAALGAYGIALARLKRFSGKYLTNKKYARSLKGHILHSWINRLYENKDYYRVIKVVSRHGSRVPLGKRAETYLRVGNSYAVLSLLPDAVKTLSMAREIGSPAVAEEAMISLGRVYLSQRDPGAVERLMKNFSKRFPNTAYKGEVRGIFAKAAYMKGDYKTYLDFVALSGDPDILRARALKRLRRYSEALSVYEGVVSGKETGDVKTVTAAYIGAADCSFMLGRYAKAVSLYNSALERMGEGGDVFRSWVLYRITQSYSRLDDRGKVQEALDSISEVDDAFGRSAASLFKG